MLYLRTAALLGLLASFAHGDTLRLRDGTVIVGNYVGGSQTEVWFQRSPAGAEAFPLFAVESLRFGNLIGSSTPSLPAPSVIKPGSVKVIRKRPAQLVVESNVPKPPTVAALFRTFASSARLAP